MTFNAFRIKREAHNLSRHDSGWNPFGHTFKRKKENDGRRGTWNGLPDPELGGLSPVEHAQTAPEYADPRRRRSSEDDIVPGSSKEAEAPDAEQSQQDSGETFVGSHRTNSATEVPNGKDGKDGMRRRIAGKNEGADEQVAPDVSEKKKEPKQHSLFKNVKPKEPFTVANQLQRTLLNSWINILLLAAPAGIAINYVPSVNRIAVFVVNFIAIVPLAAMLSFATEEIALRTGETLGGLLNATFGNAVELIVAIMALIQRKVVIVQTSLIGSILSNLLLVMGMCFFAGGLRRDHQYFNTTVAQTAASLLALAVAGVIVPTVFDRNSDTPDSDVASLSRGTSVILLVVYAAYLYFQLKTHSSMFAEESQKVPMRPTKRALKDGAIAQGLVRPAAVMGAQNFSQKSDNEKLREMVTTPVAKDDDDEEDPQLHFFVALATLTISTVIIAFCAEFMVDGIDAVTKGGTISEEFVGLILLPIVGNAAEHATAVTVAIKDKMDLAIGVAVGSSMQVALFLIPMLVVIGWGLGNDNMNLSFDLFQVAVLFVSVLLVNYLIADGKSHWLEGMLLMCLYCIISVCSWWYPGGNNEGNGSSNGTNSTNGTTESFIFS